MPKRISDTFIFKQYSEYSKKLYEFIISCERINTKSAEFDDVLFDVKRRKISDKLVKVITSSNVVLGIGKDPLPKAFKVFVSKDPKDSSKLKVFIDVTGIIKYDNGYYTCKSIDAIVSYLESAITTYIYVNKDHTLTGNSSVVKDGGECFMRMFSYIIDLMYKTTSVQQIKHRLDYLSSIYYQINIIGRDTNRSMQNISAVAMKMSDITKQEAELTNMLVEPSDFEDLNKFINMISRVFKFKGLTIASFMDLWMKKFDTGSIFAPEYLPAFCTVMTNTYIGGYVNSQQLLIEKICGGSMIAFAKTLIQIGDSVI